MSGQNDGSTFVLVLHGTVAILTRLSDMQSPFLAATEASKLATTQRAKKIVDTDAC